MEADVVFYILGISLTVLALAISVVGLRFESFPPSRPVQLLSVGVFVLLIAGAVTAAWINGEDEQDHLRAEQEAGELPTPAEVNEELAATGAEQEAEAEGEAPPEEGGTETASADGAALFESEGCAGCHALQAAGSTGQVGPDLDVELKGADPKFVEESIVDPNAELAEGFGPSIMPQNFGDTLSPEELDALVQYLVESTKG